MEKEEIKPKLEAIKVKLLEWECQDDNTLRMYFEKVPLYEFNVDFEGNVYSIFSDFGYLEIFLTYNDKIKGRTTWLNEYINVEDVFIEEQLGGRIIFWEGQYIDRIDWSSSYSIPFNDIRVEIIPLSTEEWKAMYINMTLNYGKIWFELDKTRKEEFNQQKVKEMERPKSVAKSNFNFLELLKSFWT